MLDEITPLRVFVVGCARSGTTLAQRLLSERLGLYSLPETRFFANMIGNVEPRMFPQTQRAKPAASDFRSRVREVLGVSTGMEWQNMATVAEPPRKGRVSMAIAAAEFVNELDEKAARNGCRGWLEKTPIHVHFVPQILKYVPDAWVVHVIRSPLQTIASIRDAARKHPEPWALIFDRIERAADNWNASMRDSARAVGLPRQVFLPYEALADDPESILSDLSRRMGVVPQWPQRQSFAGHLAEPREVWKSAALGQPVCPAPSKWVSALTEEERRLVEGMVQPVPLPLARAMQEFTHMPLEAARS